MKVSFDGLRRNTTASMQDLYRAIREVLDDDKYNDIDENLKNDLMDSFDEASRKVTTFNCLYDDSIEDDFNDMSELDTDRFERE